MSTIMGWTTATWAVKKGQVETLQRVETAAQPAQPSGSSEELPWKVYVAFGKTQAARRATRIT